MFNRYNHCVASWLSTLLFSKAELWLRFPRVQLPFQAIASVSRCSGKLSRWVPPTIDWPAALPIFLLHQLRGIPHTRRGPPCVCMELRLLRGLLRSLSTIHVVILYTLRLYYGNFEFCSSRVLYCLRHDPLYDDRKRLPRNVEMRGRDGGEILPCGTVTVSHCQVYSNTTVMQ